MDLLWLVLGGLVCFLGGVEVGGRWAAWLGRRAARHAGVSERFERALEELRSPTSWRT